MKASLISALLTAMLAALFPSTSRAESVIVKWEKIYNGPGNGRDEPAAVAVDSEGNVIVTGSSYNANSLWDYYTAKYAAANGVLLWEKHFTPPNAGASASPADLAVDGADNVIVTGWFSNNGSIDFYTVKYAAANGARLWEKRYNGPDNNDDFSWSLALDSAGNVIVTGSSYTAVSKSDFYTAKYAAVNGALLWERRYNGPGPGISEDRGTDVAVDGAGNAIVTGHSGTYPIDFDHYTAKYAAADGALLWEKRYHGPGGGNNAYRVRVDSQGNAIITGNPKNSGGKIDSYVAKYAAADGALLWEKRVIGPGGSWYSGSSEALDDAGNVIIAGTLYDSVGIVGSQTSKFAAADGALLWVKFDNELSVSVYEGVGLDHEGNVIVTGGSVGIGGKNDICTAKYAAADGALLWEKRYKGTGNSDSGLAIAVDSAGGIIVLGSTHNSTDSQDYYTAKYVSADGDEDGLLDSWETAHFGGTAGQSALGDTDGDGTVELLELAFGTDPLKPGAGAGPAVVVEGGYLTTTITKQPGVAYLVQTTATPGAGFSGTSTTVLTDTATTLKVRDNVLIGTQPARFMRVKVTAAP